MSQTEIKSDKIATQPGQKSFKGLSGMSIRAKLISLIMLVSISVLLISGLITVYSDYHSQKAQLSNQLTSLSKLVGNRTAAALAFFDEKTAYENLSALEAIPFVKLACLYSNDGSVFTSFKHKIGDTYACSASADEHRLLISQDKTLLSADYNIMDGSEVAGSIFLHSSYKPIYDQVIDRLLMIVLNIAIGTVFAIVLASWLQKLISSPIEKIHDAADEIIVKNDYSIRAPKITNDEIGRMANSFNRMLETIESKNKDLEEQVNKRKDAEHALRDMNTELEDRIEIRTIELARKNEELSEAMNVLEQAKDELVQSEKLASLGSVVAGVAHELNTPIGIGVTAASTIERTIQDFRDKISSNQISRRDLDHFMETSEDGMTLILGNLSRASELVKSFKQVAVDQTSENRRTFNLRLVVEEIIATLQPKFKRTPHEIHIDIPEEINLDSFPGPFGQVLTNLVMNSLLHGFNNDMHGVIEISATEVAGDQVNIKVKDNGTGISSDYLKHVFDPFFTTKMGQGGSGLGMHIVYTIITAVMGGKISITSTPGVETEISMTLPLKAPGQDNQPV